MQIGIDLSITALNQAGSAIYAASLFDALQRAAPEHTYQVFSVGHQRTMGTRKSLASRAQVLYHDLLWTHGLLPLQVARSKIDVLHMPANVIPAIRSRPTVVTINDALVISDPQDFPLWQRTYARLFLPLSAHRADAILTISEASKRNIVHYLTVSPEKITVTSLAAHEAFRPVPDSEIAAIKDKYGLKQFVLAVCTLEPRKNLTRLIRAFAQLKQKQPEIPHQLVHVGPKGWMFDSILAEVEQSGLSDHVRFLGHVPMDDLVRLYNAASVFVYPSLYEGFGLPVLEAMRCGCPVITSRTSSLPEVAGDAAILVDPLDVGEIAQAIANLLNDPVRTNELRHKGLIRAEVFSWEKCARQTLEVYRRLAG